MRNVYLYIVFLLISFSGLGQGVDVIFFIDNSDSMQSKVPGTTLNREYEDLLITVQNLMTSILSCNSDNRVAVVQFSYKNYYVNGTIEERPRIYIEGDGSFKNTPFTFSRRFYSDAGYTFACTDLLRDVLTGTFIPTTPQRVYGAQTLNRTPGNKLVVCMITDAEGENDFNDLIPKNSSGNASFASYTSFKNTLDAKFVVILGPGTSIPNSSGLNSIDKSVGSGISSRVGSYTGAVANYSNDPDGAGLVGRKLLLVGNDPEALSGAPNQQLNDADFLLNSSQLETVTGYICMESPIVCHSNLILNSPDYNVIANQTQLRQASNTITASNVVNNGAVGVYHAGNDVVLKSGFHSANGSIFRGYIEGCSGTFVGRPGSDDETKETQEMPELSLKEEKLFSLSPNPATEFVKITSAESMQSIVVTSFEGKIIFNTAFKGETNDYELYIRDYLKGFYSITVTTRDGEIQTQKLIKD